MVGWLIALGVVVVLLMIVIGMYNGLVSSRENARNGWSQIDVQLKRRADLVPNLVETAKGYMKHEKETLEAVVKARQMAVSAGDDVQKRIEAENMLSSTLRSLFAVTENYPDLKANENMMQLQEELTSTENRIGFARQAYNDGVAAYNTKLDQFPTNIVANFGDFKKAEYFEIEDPADREVVKVQF